MATTQRASRRVLIVAASLVFARGTSAEAQPAQPPQPASPPPSPAGPAAPVAPVAPAIPAPPPMTQAPPAYPYSAPYPYPYPYPYAAPAPSPYLGSTQLPPLLPRRRRDMGLFVGGVTAVAVGVGAVLLGSYFAASAAGRIDIYCDMPSVPCAHKTDAQRMTGGAITMALGAVVGVAGVPMWIIGSQYITLPRTETSPQPPSSRAPEIRLGLGQASVTLRF